LFLGRFDDDKASRTLWSTKIIRVTLLCTRVEFAFGLSGVGRGTDVSHHPFSGTRTRSGDGRIAEQYVGAKRAQVQPWWRSAGRALFNIKLNFGFNACPALRGNRAN
jgi:hypothetical protein